MRWMIMRFVFITLGLVALLLIAGCATKVAPPARPAPVPAGPSVDAVENDIANIDNATQDLNFSDLDTLDQDLNFG
jgi:hypothetical protein